RAIVEKECIRRLVELGFVVIAAGGGGIPVYVEEDGTLEGVDAVIDKDRAAAVLGRDLGASELYILTGVDKVALNFGTPHQQDLNELTLEQAKKYLAEGHFPPGSMGPKIEAAIDFLQWGGKLVVITSIQGMPDALDGLTGTRIVP
ncbi:MAG: carbamate kinase, partial [candidate division KSB1 bacterium]|nr:carbamate kinase [candidate division KSB1 bacterium]